MSSTTPTPDPVIFPDRHRRRSRFRRPLLLLIFVILIAVIALGALVILGLLDIRQSPVQVGDIRPFSAPPPYEMSPAQQTMRLERGDPDAFTLLFYDEEYGGETTRLETWIYAAEGWRCTWINGVLDSSESLPAEEAEILPLPYTPEQFTAYMSLEEVLGATAIDEFIQVPLEKELVPGGESYFADRLAFGLKDGDLLYVEAVGYAAMAETAVDSQQEIAAATAVPSPTAAPPATATAPPPTATSMPPTATAVPPTATASPIPTPAYPNVPLVFSSDHDAPNYDECHPDNTCPMQLFYSASPQTGQATNLTSQHGFYDAYAPALSPDGRFIAFTGKEDEVGFSHIYVMDTAGDGLTQLTNGNYSNVHPTWSPDGSRIAFMTREVGRDSWNLTVVDVDTKELEQLTTIDVVDRYPDWSPDGTYIVFHSSRVDSNPGTCWPDCKLGLYVVDVDTLELFQLRRGNEPILGASADWSPDGNKLAFQSDEAGSSDIYILDFDHGITRLSDTPSDEYLAAWSPDGRFIAFVGDSSNGKDIGVTPVDRFDATYFTDWDATDYYPDW